MLDRCACMHSLMRLPVTITASGSHHGILPVSWKYVHSCKIIPLPRCLPFCDEAKIWCAGQNVD